MAQTTVERVIPSLASPPLVPPAHPSCCPRATVYFENSRCFVVVVAPCYSFSLARCWFPSWDSIPVVAPPRLPPVVSNVHGLISIPCDAAFACRLPAPCPVTVPRQNSLVLIHCTPVPPDRTRPASASPCLRQEHPRPCLTKLPLPRRVRCGTHVKAPVVTLLPCSAWLSPVPTSTLSLVAGTPCSEPAARPS